MHGYVIAVQRASEVRTCNKEGAVLVFPYCHPSLMIMGTHTRDLKSDRLLEFSVHIVWGFNHWQSWRLVFRFDCIIIMINDSKSDSGRKNLMCRLMLLSMSSHCGTFDYFCFY